jgi:hypothetical protein
MEASFISAEVFSDYHLVCLLVHLLRFIYRHISGYARVNMPCRRTKTRCYLV